MSGTAAARLPQRAPRPIARPKQPAPRLRVVAPSLGTSRAKLAWTCVGMLCAGLVALLMLTIDLGSGAYTLTQLQRQQRELGEQRQALTEQVQAMEAAPVLDRRARRLGMVSAPNTAFVEVPGGAVRGESAAATAPPKPAPTVAETDSKKTDPKKADAEKSDAKKSDTTAKSTESKSTKSTKGTTSGDEAGKTAR